MNGKANSYVRSQPAPILPPPPSQAGITGWLYQHFISSMANFSTPAAAASSLFTMLLVFLLLWFGGGAIIDLFSFAIIDAVWGDPSATRRLACSTVNQGGELPAQWSGLCWPYIFAKWQQYIYGRYPASELWRVDIVYAIGAAGLIYLMIPRLPRKGVAGVFMLLIYPPLSFILLTGANLHVQWSLPILAICLVLLALGRLGTGSYLAKATNIFEPIKLFAPACSLLGWIMLYLIIATFLSTIDYGMQTVETSRWGGLLVTLVVAVTGIVASLPLGILLALGRRSQLPVIRVLSVGFIEFWRGVPLITVLFMASVMLPLFTPEGVDFNKLLRALVGVALFSSAYMAEVVRGGLQAIPAGQFEGARALGLSYWQMMHRIILPQSLTLVIPGIVNSFIALFKDTTLVLIIGLFDILGSVQSTLSDSNWATPVTALSGYLVTAAIFWIFCFTMSRYSVALEHKYRRKHK